jgi:hypothetical protein
VKDPLNPNDRDDSGGDQGNGPGDVRRPPGPGDAAPPTFVADRIMMLQHHERQTGGRRPLRLCDPPGPSWVRRWILQTYHDILPEWPRDQEPVTVASSWRARAGHWVIEMHLPHLLLPSRVVVRDFRPNLKRLRARFHSIDAMGWVVAGTRQPDGSRYLRVSGTTQGHLVVARLLTRVPDSWGHLPSVFQGDGT